MPDLEVSPFPAISDYSPWVGGPTQTPGHTAVVALPAGGFFSVWSATGLAGGGINGRFHDSDGQARDFSGIRLETSGSNYRLDAVVEASGSILVTSTADALRAYRISADGSTIDDLGILADDNAGSSDVLTFSQVVALDDGGIALLWATNSPVVNLSFYDADGTLRTTLRPDMSAALEAVELFGSVRDGALTLLEDGKLVGTFLARGTEYLSAGSRQFSDIFVQRYNADGSLQGGPQRLTSDVAAERNPKIATLSDGGYIVAWSDGNTSIEFQLFNADGTARAALQRFDPLPDIGYAQLADILALPSGGFLMIYGDGYGQLFDGAGAALGDPNQFNTSGLSYDDLSLAVLEDGKIAYGASGGRGFEILQVNSLAEGVATINPDNLVEGRTLTRADVDLTAITDAQGTAGLSDAQVQFFVLDAEGGLGNRVWNGELSYATAGQRIAAQVTFIDGAGNSETVISAPSVPVQNVNDAPEGLIRVNDPVEGQSVGALISVIDRDNYATGSQINHGTPGITYQWLTDGVEISGATDRNYTPTQDMVGQVLTLQISYIDAFGTTETFLSDPSAPVRNNDDPLLGSITASGMTGSLPGFPPVPAQFDVITVDTSGLSDRDGIDSIAYRFYYRTSAGVDVTLQEGAEASFAVDNQGWVNQTLYASVIVTDNFGGAGSTSLLLGRIQNTNDAPAGGVTIAGTVREGETLTANVSLIDGDGIRNRTVTYQWFRDGVDIADARLRTFALTQEDVGAEISVTASYTDSFNTPETMLSPVTAPVENVNDPVVGVPVVSGSYVEDATLMVDASALSDEDGLGELEYAWLRDGITIEGATGTSYTLKQADVGAQIVARVSYIDQQGTAESVQSREVFTAVANVDDPTTGTPVIDGTALEGEQLVANVASIEDEDGTADLRYQWYADGVLIGGASLSEFRPREQQISARITVEVTHTDDYGIVSRLESAATAPIEALPRDLADTEGLSFLQGNKGNDTLRGLEGEDRLVSFEGNDSLDGGPGADTLNAGDGDDTIIGGPADDDLRDIIYGGEGHDSIDGGAGNDLVYGQGGNDTIAGGFGVDELQGQDGDDVITGSAFSDLVFGGAGDDFVNGGFGSDRINGGIGADKFFHVGLEGHGSDWVQDYSAAEGDVLLFGNSAASRAQFQVNFAHTENAAGERSGDDAVQEAFVIYRPTGQILWALIDGEGQSSINLQIGTDFFDLLE
ncbi:calcium-binding protein [Ruegeria aquimaris]|uniref:Uncharacterized protein n=1 Tax=Ruegeria aquimaris TaxID=2984333 RepID=A0ABT3ARL2_9RHOB|nr:hypothetical protein [Ruegeria sp. XHP0148]MCV2891320.1 hypothetical protein [Ruegeria sp. XHP0148]